MDNITIDGLDENDFRRSIEGMLRHGEADAAAGRLRSLLEPYAGEGRLLPARFLTVSSEEIALSGWDALGERLGAYDRPQHQISAVSVTIIHPEDAGRLPDAAGKLAPSIETSYYSDEAYPFSEAARSDLLEGYSLYGCEWDGNYETSDTTLSVDGIDDLYGAIIHLEAKLLSSGAPDVEEIRAGSLGSCYLAVLIHQAVRDNIRNRGLPRPLCVMVGSNGVYPFFDAPVMSREEYQGDGETPPAADDERPAQAYAEEAEAGELAEDSGSYDSLLSITTRKAKKKPVLMLDPAEAESAARHDELAAAQQMAEAGERALTGLRVGLETLDVVERADAFAYREDSGEADTFEETAGYRETMAPDLREPDRAPPHDDRPAVADRPIEVWQEVHRDDPIAAAPEPEPEPEFPKFAEADAGETYDSPPDPAAVDDDELPELWDSRMPTDEEAIAAAEADTVVALAEPGEPVSPQRDLPLPKPAPNLNGHRLRARIVQTPEARKTFLDRIVALLQRFLDWAAAKRK